MYLMQFTAYKGAVKIEKLFKTQREATIAGFELTADRPDGLYTITYIEVDNEQ